MGINLGSSTPSDYKLGSNQVNKIYHGSDKVWEIEQDIGMLNDFPGAEFSFSLMKLRNDYSGPAIEVTRDDMTSTDIGFKGILLDTASIKSFIGANGNGYVTRWYNQVDGGNDLVPYGAAGTEPRIATNGVIYVDADGFPSVSISPLNTNTGFEMEGGTDLNLANTTLTTYWRGARQYPATQLIYRFGPGESGDDLYTTELEIGSGVLYNKLQDNIGILRFAQFTQSDGLPGAGIYYLTTSRIWYDTPTPMGIRVNQINGDGNTGFFTFKSITSNRFRIGLDGSGGYLSEITAYYNINKDYFNPIEDNIIGRYTG